MKVLDHSIHNVVANWCRLVAKIERCLEFSYNKLTIVCLISRTFTFKGLSLYAFLNCRKRYV